MRRRTFLASAAISAGPVVFGSGTRGAALGQDAGDTRTFATPEAARKSPPETLAYAAAIYSGTDVHKPDYLATVDLDPKSATYSRVIHRLAMPNIGDELHHFGWNACASCHGERARRFLVLPGLVSGRIHVVDTLDPRRPRMHTVIEPKEVIARAKLTGPHTVHCLADGTIMISMIGDENGNAPGGFLLLDDDFKVVGSWQSSLDGMNFNYDFWYQPRRNVMVSSEWGALNTVRPGFKPDDVKAGKYGHSLQFWDWKQRRIVQSIDLGDEGRIPLEVRFHHDPDSSHGFVGAALSSAVWHWFQDRSTGSWKAEKVVQVEPRELKGWDFPVPGLITDVVLALDDRWLYFSNWLHGDVRQYDVSDPSKPRLAARLQLGGVFGNPPKLGGKRLEGGPQMLQLSLDGRRLYVTNSLFSSWDDQFYPGIAKSGSSMLKVDCDTDRGGMVLDERFHVDFGEEPDGPSRAHEVRFPGGDSTSDIWV